MKNTKKRKSSIGRKLTAPVYGKVVGFLPLIGTVFAVDQLAKRYVEEDTRLSAPTAEVHELGGHLGIMRYHNPGMMLNLGKHKQNMVKLLSVSMTIVCCFVFVLTLGSHGKKLLQAGLALLLGGAFSNTYDRMARGHVVDYVRFPKAPKMLRQVVFNIADFAILIGALLAVIGEASN
ncbi:MAG: signal peptidase II [Lachnospiraceae bacterium]|nr:signal peptidase II [Lachnospiraceae bacterium]